ncbi:MAG: MutS family DNA mismatch repair protein [Balneolaceae bacterium]
MSEPESGSLRRAIHQQIQRLNGRIESLQEQSRKLSFVRLGVFAAGVLLFYLALTSGSIAVTILVLLLFAGSFIWLIRQHNRIDRTLEIFSEWKKIRAGHLARIDLDWPAIPYKPDMGAGDNGHPFARDLNITGKEGLLHLVDTSIYIGGLQRLKSWLLSTKPEPENLQERHQIVKELTALPYFRDRLKLYASLGSTHQSEKDWDMNTLLKWLHSSNQKKHSYISPLFLLGGLAAANIVLGLLYLSGVLAPWFIFTFVAYLVIYNLNSSKTAGLFDEAYQIDKLMSSFSSVLLHLEQYHYKKSPALRNFCAPFLKTEHRPSVFLNKIVRLSSVASSRQNEILWALLNLTMPWDLFFSWRMDIYKKKLEPNLRLWLDRFYELEGLGSLANFAWLNPEYRFYLPEKSDKTNKPAFSAKGLGHPLIPKGQKVTNDLTIGRNGEILLITGSNMAGKSTFLRTVGINLCLCFAGAPVNARELATLPFRLFSSINITDSLSEGLSHFYAEVKRLRQLLDELEKPSDTPLFFFVDEIFRGTNNRERLIGSTSFLKRVAGQNGIGMVSTHDLELSELEQKIPQLTNYHFEETIEGDKMSFEYKLRPGPCSSTNALKIMQMEGLPTQ